MKKLALCIIFFSFLIPQMSFGDTYTENFDNGLLNPEMSWEWTGVHEIINGEIHVTEGLDEGYGPFSLMGYQTAQDNLIVTFFQADIRASASTRDCGLKIYSYDNDDTSYEAELWVNTASGAITALLQYALYDESDTILGSEDLGTLDISQTNTLSIRLNENSVTYGINGVQYELFIGLQNHTNTAYKTGGRIEVFGDRISDVAYWADNLIAETLEINVFDTNTQETVVLTATSPDTTIRADSSVLLYGTSTANTITLESGAKAELVNFPGQNSIEIQSSSDLFTVSRSGTVVTFQGSDETILKIPVTIDIQSISFNDRSLTLSIYNNEVMIDDQVINTTSAIIENSENEQGLYQFLAMTQNYNNTDYFIAFAITGDSISSIDVLDGPNIVSTWDNHASLSVRPEQGDTYIIRINYTDGNSEETSYIVEGVNDHPALIVWPENFEIIDTTKPTFEWRQETGISSDYMIVIHKIEGDEEAPVWTSDYIAPGDTSCVFNFDNRASESLQPGETYKLYLHSYDENGNQATSTIVFIISENGNYTGTCGAYIAPDVWQEFDCYNLAAIGKDLGHNPFTPSWSLIGGYWQWGRKGPDPSVWHFTNTPNFAHGPTGPDASEANAGEISGWDSTYAPDGSWSDSHKTANDPCPDGFRVPSNSQWEGVLDNNTLSYVGTWSTTWDDHTNYSAAYYFGNDLMLPAAGGHNLGDSGGFGFRGHSGKYWSSLELPQISSEWPRMASFLHLSGRMYGMGGAILQEGLSVRCISE